LRGGSNGKVEQAVGASRAGAAPAQASRTEETVFSLMERRIGRDLVYARAQSGERETNAGLLVGSTGSPERICGHDHGFARVLLFVELQQREFIGRCGSFKGCVSERGARLLEVEIENQIRIAVVTTGDPNLDFYFY